MTDDLWWRHAISWALIHAYPPVYDPECPSNG